MISDTPSEMIQQAEKWLIEAEFFNAPSSQLYERRRMLEDVKNKDEVTIIKVTSEIRDWAVGVVLE